jgi:hypothetical protein
MIETEIVIATDIMETETAPILTAIATDTIETDMIETEIVIDMRDVIVLRFHHPSIVVRTVAIIATLLILQFTEVHEDKSNFQSKTQTS